MRPLSLVHKLLEEERCCTTATTLATNILDVGDLALGHLAVPLGQGHLPQLGPLQLSLVVAEEASIFYEKGSFYKKMPINNHDR